MWKNYFGSIAFLLLSLSVCTGQTSAYPIDPPSRITRHPVALSVRSYIHHISDINIRDQQYKIEIWLYLTAKDSIQDWDSLAYQFQVKSAKEMSVTVIPQYHSAGTTSQIINHKTGQSFYRKLIKINCTIAQDWDVDNYPFDKQNLNIVCFTVRPQGRVILIPEKSMITYSNNGEDFGGNIENGWFIVGDSLTIERGTQKDISDSTHSAIQFSMQISRRQIPALFFKLFIGMYVSFLVAFIALFIDVTHVEPRFGLPVGGLFAAIGNKYIMESILPPTSQFTIVDALHTYTIIAILLIIVFSAISLKLVRGHFPTDRGLSARFPLLTFKQMNWIDKKGAKFIFAAYATLNISSVLWGLIHERSWF